MVLCRFLGVSRHYLSKLGSCNLICIFTENPDSIIYFSCNSRTVKFLMALDKSRKSSPQKLIEVMIFAIPNDLLLSRMTIQSIQS